MKVITVADLTEHIGTPGPHPILYCLPCGAEFSANGGDYWDLPNEHEFYCCGEPMLLVYKRVVYEEVVQ